MIVPCFQKHSELGERVGVIRFEPKGSPHRLFRRFQFSVQVSYPAEKKPEVCIPGEYFQRGREFLRRLGKRRDNCSDRPLSFQASTFSRLSSMARRASKAASANFLWSKKARAWRRCLSDSAGLLLCNRMSTPGKEANRGRR